MEQRGEGCAVQGGGQRPVEAETGAAASSALLSKAAERQALVHAAPAGDANRDSSRSHANVDAPAGRRHDSPRSDWGRALIVAAGLPAGTQKLSFAQGLQGW